MQRKTKAKYIQYTKTRQRGNESRIMIAG